MRARTVLLAALLICTSATAAELDDLRKSVSDLAKPLLIKDADIGVRVSQSAVNQIVAKVASLSPEQRKVTFRSSSRNGKIWDTTSGYAGCGGFAEVDELNIDVSLPQFNAQAQAEGKLAVNLVVEATVNGKVHGHIHGPSVPFANCSSTIGGGAGGVKAVSATKGESFTAVAAFTPAANGSIDYAVRLTSPARTSVTISVELFRINNWIVPTLGIPVSFDLPGGPIITGTGFKVISTSGNMNVSGQERPYEIELTDLKLLTDPSGIDMRAKVGLKIAEGKKT